MKFILNAALFAALLAPAVLAVAAPAPNADHAIIGADILSNIDAHVHSEVRRNSVTDKFFDFIGFKKINKDKDN